MVQLVKLQAKEVDALKAEINMLRRKGGHVYTPAVSAPGMGDMGPMLDDEMMMQQQQEQNKTFSFRNEKRYTYLKIYLFVC